MDKLNCKCTVFRLWKDFKVLTSCFEAICTIVSYNNSNSHFLFKFYQVIVSFIGGNSSSRLYQRVPDQEDGLITCLSSEVASSSILIGREKGGVSVYNDISTTNQHLPHVSRQGGKILLIDIFHFISVSFQS